MTFLTVRRLDNPARFLRAPDGSPLLLSRNMQVFEYLSPLEHKVEQELLFDGDYNLFVLSGVRFVDRVLVAPHAAETFNQFMVRRRHITLNCVICISLVKST